MFPLDSAEMDKFIFDGSYQKWENYISNIKKLLTPACITTNDTALEEKSKNNEKIDLNNISSYNISLEEKDGGLFSPNDEENYDDYM